MYRILLVEDDNVIASQVEKHLTAWGYEVRRATDYQNILADFAAFQPHLVLLDIGLPFFNGYHWCAEIRPPVQGADFVPLLRLGQHEHRYGHEPGRRRFCRQAL